MTEPFIATMRRTVITGPYGWDRERLPEDEVFLRRRWLQQRLQALGLDLLLVHGDTEDCGVLSWATNFHPKLHWAAALIAPSGDAVLCLPGPTRDLPAARAMSFDCPVEPVHRLGDVLRECLARSGKPPQHCRVGILAHDAWRLDADSALRAAAAGIAGAAFESLPEGAIRPPFGSRDRALHRRAQALWADGAQAFRQAWSQTRLAHEAIRATERQARLAGAHEVRVLASRDGGLTLSPLPHGASPPGERGVAYIAVQFLGVWADGFLTVPPGDCMLVRSASAVLAQLEQRVRERPGLGPDLQRLYAAAAPLQAHPMVARNGVSVQGRSLRPAGEGGMPGEGGTPGEGGIPDDGAPMAVHAGVVDGCAGALVTRFID